MTMEQKLNLFINKALSWLIINLENFSLPSEEVVKKEVICLRRKAFGELCVCSRLMYRNPKLKKNKDIEKILNYIDDTAKTSDFCFDMMRRTSLLPLYLIVFITLESCGRKLPKLRTAIQRILDFGFVDSVGRELWSLIDLKNYLDSGEFKCKFPDFKSLYRPSSAYHLPPIPYLSVLEVYDITHIIFNMADFGQRDLKPILEEKIEETQEYINLLLGTYVYKQDWDLVAEILICCLCLNYRPSPLYELAWSALFQAQTNLGDLPSRYYNSDNSDLDQANATDTYRFKINYHTTLVGLMAATLENENYELL